MNWIYALKLNAWPKILVPCLVGLGIGFFQTKTLSFLHLITCICFCIFNILYILFLNDYGDRNVDSIKRKLFPFSSKKVIFDGFLSSKQVFRGGIAFFVIAAAITIFMSIEGERPHLIWFFIAGACLFQAYTFTPFKLNYRGGGELLEAFGVGILIPWSSAYWLSGQIWALSYLFFLPFLLLVLLNALASGLSDEESDRVGGKTTFTTIWGNSFVRNFIEICLLLTPTLWLGVAIQILPEKHWWIVIIACAGIWVYYYPLLRISFQATTRQFKQHTQYKKILHKIIWTSSILFTLSSAISTYLSHGS